MRAYKAKKFNKLNMQEEFDRITKKSFLKKLGEAMTPQVQAAAGKYLLTQLENNYTDWPFPSFKKKYGE
jgi:hypothetical protein